MKTEREFNNLVVKVMKELDLDKNNTEDYYYVYDYIMENNLSKVPSGVITQMLLPFVYNKKESI